jgi:hypothetical protein
LRSRRNGSVARRRIEALNEDTPSRRAVELFPAYSKRIVIVVHTNHPNEIDFGVERALSDLRAADALLLKSGCSAERRVRRCAAIARAARQIDVRAFNPAFPKSLLGSPAIWRFCVQLGLDVCNGNRIDDRKSCDDIYCQIRGKFDRINLLWPQYNAVLYSII